MYELGERVIINPDIEGYKKGDPVLLGLVTAVKEDPRKTPGTLYHPTIVEVIGDDDKKYYSLILKHGVPSPDNFMNYNEFKDVTSHIRQSIIKEIEVMESFQNIYVSDITYRLTYGVPFEKAKKHYESFIMSTLIQLKTKSEAVGYLYDAGMEAFLKSDNFPDKFGDDGNDDDFGDDNDT